MLTDEEVRRRLIKTNNIRRWYQKVPYGDVVYPFNTHFEDGKTNASSYDCGRWWEYIEPILKRNEDDWKNSTICEVGCSAGLFLLRAWEYFRFRKVLGVEAANGGYEQLMLTKDYYDRLPLVPYKLALGKLTETVADSDAPQINMDTFPIVDITLMSCVHYHMEVSYLREYLRWLASKSLYLMLLTDEKAGGPTNASSKFFRESILDLDDWRIVDVLRTQPEWLKLQPPCKDLTILFYKSNSLKRLLVKECFEKQMNWHKDKRGQHVGWYEYVQEFYMEVFPRWVDAVLSGRVDENNYKDSLVYKWQREGFYGSTAWSNEIASERTLSYINIIKTMKHHGQEQPIGLQEHLNMVDPWDGWHRVATAKYLGLKYIYSVDVIPEGE